MKSKINYYSSIELGDMGKKTKQNSFSFYFFSVMDDFNLLDSGYMKCTQNTTQKYALLILYVHIIVETHSIFYKTQAGCQQNNHNFIIIKKKIMIFKHQSHNYLN